MSAKKWDDEGSAGESSSEESTSGPAPVQIRRKFDDEEAEDDDVLESWDAAEDSEVEREKAKKAAEAKAKADAEAAANKKSKAERIAERQQRRKELDEEDESDDEDEAARRLRLRRTEKESDLKHAEDLLGGIGVPAGRKAVNKGAAVAIDSKDATKTIDLTTLPLFNPTTKAQYDLLREVLAPILAANPKRSGYVPFLEEFVKALVQDLPSDQVKKISSRLTALSNEKMKAEKEKKGVKKTKAAKTKTSLVATRADVPDTTTYDEGTFGDDDFM